MSVAINTLCKTLVCQSNRVTRLGVRVKVLW